MEMKEEFLKSPCCGAGISSEVIVTTVREILMSEDEAEDAEYSDTEGTDGSNDIGLVPKDK